MIQETSKPVFYRRSDHVKVWRLAVLAAFVVLLGGCTGIPAGAIVVQDFELDRYLGTWYEIARLDHSFERGLSNVQARYSVRDDGGVRVINRGYVDEKQEWSEAEGKAYFVEGRETGKLKVSFFGPFYGAYNIIDLDTAGYQYALVVGNSTRYMWILARNPQLDGEILGRLVSRARQLGFATDELIYPAHNAAGE
jgi:apolipoprotein D and lipocalin family protein